VPDLGRRVQISASRSGTLRGLDEEVAEGRVREVGIVRRQHDLRVAGQLDRPVAGAKVRDHHPPQLGVVFGRHDDLGPRLDPVVHAAEDGAVGREGDLVLLGLPAGGLVGRGPDAPALEVADVAEAAPAVGRDVLAPARHRGLLARL
jgi:hypothetical protein